LRARAACALAATLVVVGPAAVDAGSAVGSFHHVGLRGAWGTAFLIGRAGPRRGLVLTVAHNLPSPATRGYVRLAGGRAQVLREVVGSAELDYSVLEVELSRKVRRVQPLRLGDGVRAGEPVSVVGFPERPGRPRRETRDGAARTGTRTLVQLEEAPDRAPIPSYVFDYAPALGLSGAPVVSYDSGRVVAVHHAGDDRFSYGVPAADLRHDLAARVARLPASDPAAEALGRWLRVR
jgi:S1-C subfamily serine protease